MRSPLSVGERFRTYSVRLAFAPLIPLGTEASFILEARLKTLFLHFPRRGPQRVSPHLRFYSVQHGGYRGFEASSGDAEWFR